MPVAKDKGLRCVVVTPERPVFEEPAEFVALPLYDGELGVLPGRAPLVARLGYGLLRVQRAGSERRFYIDGGFVEVASDAVSVLTLAAIPPEQIDRAAARSRLEEALRRRPTSAAEFADRDLQLARARAQLAAVRQAAS